MDAIQKLKIVIRLKSAQAEVALNRFRRKLDKLSNKRYTKSLNKTQRGLDKVGGKLNLLGGRVSSKATRGLAGIGTGLAGIAKFAGIASVAVFGVIFAIKKLFNSRFIQAGIEAIESENLFGVTFGEMSKDVREWSETLSNALGLNAYEVRRTAGLFFNLAEGMRLTEKQSLTVAKGMTALANDVASFYNVKDPKRAFTVLRSALIGETEALRTLTGIDVGVAAAKLQALKSGIVDSTRELTLQEKTMARYELILERTANAHGDLARTITSPANQMRIFQANIQQLYIAVSQFLIPILNKALIFLNSLSKAFRRIIGFFGGNISTSFDFSDKVAPVNALADGMADTAKSAKSIKSSLAGFDEMNVLTETGGGSGGIGGGGAGGINPFDLTEYDPHLEWVEDRVNDAVNGWISKLKSFRDAFKKVWDSGPITNLRNTVVNLFKGIVTAIKEHVGEIRESWDEIFSPIKKNFESVFNDIIIRIRPTMELIKGPILTVLGGIVSGFRSTITPVARFVMSIVNLISSILKPLYAITGFLLQTFMPIFKLVFGVVAFTVGGAFTVVGASIGWILNVLSNLINFVSLIFAGEWSQAWDKVKNTFSNVVGFISNKLNGVRSVFFNIINFLTNTFKPKWDNIWSGAKQSFKNIFSGLANTFRDPINAVIRTINRVARFIYKVTSIPRFTIGNFSFGGWGGFDLGSIPELAQGGLVQSATTAMIGESGREAVIPLDRNTEWADLLADKINNAGGGDRPIHLNINLDGDVIYESVINRQRDEEFKNNGKYNLAVG